LAIYLAEYLAMKYSVNIGELKDKLSEYVDRVAEGHEVEVCKRNVPVAKLTSVPLRKNRTKLGFDPRVRILGEITGPIIPENEYNCLRDDHDPLA
jgi:prevent-host-death family protein